MLPRKTGPAPIFNYRKRPRQAVVADPETQPPNTASKEPPGHKFPQPQPTSSYAASSSRPAASFASRGGRGTSTVGARPSSPSPAQIQRPPPAPAAAGRSLPGQSVIQGNWRGVDNRPGPRASAPNKDWRARSPSARSPAGPSTSGGPGTSFRRQQPVHHQPSPCMGVAGRGGGGGGNNMSVATVQHSPAPPNKIAGGGDQRRNSTERSLRMLTLPVAHVKRAFGVLNDSMSPFLFCLFGIVDSATVSDMMSSGKSFTLRDESGRITCIFCEIDRQMPRLHRGQWYRAVGVAKPSWQALQCLSLRPVSLEERQAARAVTSLSIAQLNDICLSVTEM